MRFSPLFLSLALPLAALALPDEAEAQSSPATVIVMDGSGSMWGNLGPERASKFDLSRAALRQVLSKSSTAALGLVSFGHRRRADCSDVEIIAPPQPGPTEAVLAAIDKLNPKGKGPLTLALKEAAKSFEPGAAGSVILIHDGPDNCQQDPCAAAMEIAKANPRLAVHVVGLALEKPDVQRMSCVATATKGRMFDVRDAASLNASIAEAVKLANLDLGDAPPPSPSAGPSATPAPVGVPGLRLSAALAPDGPALTRPLTWRIAKSESPDEPVAQKTAAEVAQDLPPGKYVVNANLGVVKAQQAVEVGDDGPTTVRLALNAGTVRLMARATKAGDPIANPLLSISAASEASGTRRVREPIWVGRDPDAAVIVPAGNYFARVESGLASRDIAVSVAPGGIGDAQLILGAGRLDLSAVTQAGGQPLSEVTFAISEDDPEAAGGRREIARSAAPQASFTLPAGTYYVAATSGAAEARERIAIGAGQDLKHAIVLNVGRAVLSAQLDGAPPPSGQQVNFRVLRLDEGAREVARSTNATPDFLLAPGRYRFEAQLAGENVRATADVDIAAGKEFRIGMKLESAQVTVKPAASAIALHWEVKDGLGKTVLRSGLGGNKTARLAPGRYVLRADAGESRIEKPFDLKPGEQRIIDIAPQ